MRRGEWGDRTVFLDWAIGRPPCHPIVADDDGQVIGTGVATAYGPVGWVGTIFVDPERRGHGLGRALTRAVVEHLENSGCRTLLLIASDYGRPLYEREGFAVQTVHRRFAAPGSAEPADGDSTSWSARSDPRCSRRSSPSIGGRWRRSRAVIRDLATPESTRVVLGPDGAVRAFLLRGPWGGAALVAPDPTTPSACSTGAGGGPARTGELPRAYRSSNVAGRQRLTAEGWIEEPGGTA